MVPQLDLDDGRTCAGEGDFHIVLGCAVGQEDGHGNVIAAFGLFAVNVDRPIAVLGVDEEADAWRQPVPIERVSTPQ